MAAPDRMAAARRGYHPWPARRWAWLYVAIGLPVMCLLCFVMKPFGVPDEPPHFLKAISVSQGRFLPLVQRQPFASGIAPMAGDVFDDGVVRLYQLLLPGAPAGRYAPGEIWTAGSIASVKSRRFWDFSNTAIYPPFLYLPQAVGVGIGRFLGLPVLAWLYLGRLANVLSWTLLAVAAIRASDRTAPLFFVLGLMPMTLQQVSSLSLDALLFGCSIALAALLGRMVAEAPARLAPRSIAALGLVTIAFGAGKVGYILLALLPPVIAALVQPAHRRSLVFLSACTAVALILWVGWAWLIHGSVFTNRATEQVDPAEQLAFTLAHPLRVATLLGHEMLAQAPKVLLQSVGRNLGWMTMVLPVWACVGTMALVIANAATSRRRPLPTGPFALAVATGLASVVAILLLLFLQYNKVGATRIDGFQGRYIIPIVMIAAALAPGVKASERTTMVLARINIGWMTAMGVVTLLVVARGSWSLSALGSLSGG